MRSPRQDTIEPEVQSRACAHAPQSYITLEVQDSISISNSGVTRGMGGTVGGGHTCRTLQ
ncbi:hypothetical protein RRG08_057549, partial [Elysia crispata]